MRLFAHIIVENLHGHWSAWFSGTPQIGFGGKWPADAIRRLIDGHGGVHLDVDQIVEIEHATREGHFEFLVPHLNRLRLPDVSMN